MPRFESEQDARASGCLSLSFAGGCGSGCGCGVTGRNVGWHLAILAANRATDKRFLLPGLLRRLAEAASDVSIVVNNAGVALRYDLLTGDLDDLRSEIETNLIGTLLVARAFAPVLAKHDTSSLVNVASVLSWFCPQLASV